MKTSFRAMMLLCAAIGLCVPLISSAQDAAKPEGKKKKKNAGQSSVWKVKGENCTVYLAGSVHMLRREDLPLPKPFLKAYDDSEKLVFEMEPFDDGGAAAQVQSLAQGSFEEGKSLKDELSKEGYKALSDYLGNAGLPKNSMDRFRPWMVSIAITGIEMMKAGVMPDYGVESILEKRAREDQKPMSGLETVGEQLGVFEGMEKDTGEKMLMDTLKEADQIAAQFPKMVRAWKNGNGKALLRLSFDDLDDPESADMYDRILFDRNENWIKPIEKLIAGETNTMVVVGAGHLFGKRSVIDLLVKKGYTVTRLKVPSKGDGKPAKKNPAPEPKKKPERRLIPV